MFYIYLDICSDCLSMIPLSSSTDTAAPSPEPLLASTLPLLSTPSFPFLIPTWQKK